MEIIITFLSGVFFASLYFVPTVVAISRKHVNTLPIFLTNLYLGWTLIGWIAAVIWASSVMSTATETVAAPWTPKKKVVYGLCGLVVFVIMALLVTALSQINVSSLSSAPEVPVLKGRERVNSNVPPTPALRQGVPMPAEQVLGE